MSRMAADRSSGTTLAAEDMNLTASATRTSTTDPTPIASSILATWETAKIPSCKRSWVATLRGPLVSSFSQELKRASQAAERTAAALHRSAMILALSHV
jgi:hypothetical protein